MDDTINFFDKERNLVMQFKNFKFTQTEALKIVTFTTIVNFDFFHVETSFDVEEYDFRMFSLALSKIYKGEQKYISFNPLLSNIIINMSEKEGHIKVKVEIYNDLSTSKFEFIYNTDQSFIQELMMEIEAVMERNSLYTIE